MRKGRVFVCIMIACVALFAQLFYFVLPRDSANVTPWAADAPQVSPYDSVSSPNICDRFGDVRYPGIFIRRQPELIKNDKTFVGTVFAVDPNALLNPTNFKYTAKVKQNDIWIDADSSRFWVEEADSNTGVNWFLRQNTQADTYGILCTDKTTGEPIYYETTDDGQKVPIYYQVIYTEQFTFVSTAVEAGTNIIKNFRGGERTPLTFDISYNKGAIITDSLPPTDTTAVGFRYGNLDSAAVVESATFDVEVSTLSGDTYNEIIMNGKDGKIEIFFNTALRNETYIIKIFNELDPTVYGIFIIENSTSENLFENSMWFTLLMVGLIMVFAVCLLYFTPVLVRRINENRLYKETLRIKREKNPEEYVEEKKGGFMSGIRKKMEDAKAKREGRVVEDKGKKEKTNKKRDRSQFSSRLQESMQMRQYAKEHGLTRQQLDDAQKAHEKLEKAKKDSFASLRDYDTPIAATRMEDEHDNSINAATVSVGGVAYSALAGEEDNVVQPIEITSESNITSSSKEEWTLAPDGTMVLKTQPTVDSSIMEGINTENPTGNEIPVTAPEPPPAPEPVPEPLPIPVPEPTPEEPAAPTEETPATDDNPDTDAPKAE